MVRPQSERAASHRRSKGIAITAAALGVANAAVSGYWASGGTVLLDTIGGHIERWGREPDAVATLTLWAITVLKAGVALAAPAIAGIPRSLPRWTRGRLPRILSWVAACVLTAYGAVLTITGLLALALAMPGTLGAPSALAWHAYLWDPWFLLWGVALMTCLTLTRSGGQRAHDQWRDGNGS